MTPERWQTVKELVTEALARAPGERAGYLDQACGPDAELRREVESLLASGATTDFLESPAAPVASASANPLERLRAGLAGRYELERELGRGGMATVYLARDLRHERPVALKVMHPELAATLGAERFLREIRTTAGLQHPHILTVLDSGEAGGQLWYTMPYVRGESLRERIQREGELPIDVAVELARQIALALDYAHREGVVHRDLKPGNILLSEGQALVADFGVAKALAASDESQLTGTGMSVGTPAYMSPEQAAAGQVDGRADVYALGCVLYEMLAGEPPYTGRTPQAIVARRMLDPVPPLHTVRERVPDLLEQTIMRALARAPADRFQTAAEFARALAVTAVSPVGTGRVLAAAPEDVGSTTALGKPARFRRVPAGLAALITGLLFGAGLLFAWLRTRPGVEPGAERLAVLPFENLGDSADAYFADGVTDAVRDKLAALPGLEVIASTSSNQYRRTTKRPDQIGRELGARYLLIGRVRWAKDAGGASRVQVRSELVEVATRGPPTTRWQAPFEAPLTGVFEVQAGIAARVAEALGLALGAGERERLAEHPTDNLAAYDLFLKGEEAAGWLTETDLVALRQATDYYERALALDSTFALAWARLSQAYSFQHFVAPTTAGAAAARRAAERAVALAPGLAEGYLALARYHYLVRHDVPRALDESRQARQLAPKDARVLAVVGQNELALGHREEGLGHLRAALVLDPRSLEIAIRAMFTLTELRQYAEALQVAEHVRTLAPANLKVIHAVVRTHVAQGDLAGARAVVRGVPREVDPAALVAMIANWDDLYWVLDDEQQRLLLRLSPAPFGGDRAVWAFALAQTHALRGDSARARAYADSVRLVYQARLRDVPQDAVTHAYLGMALAYMGRMADAVREGERALALAQASAAPQLRQDIQRHLARTYIMAGKQDEALNLLEHHVLSPGWLRIDPAFTPLRGNPRYERLIVD
jgi:serine/threonine-protein kinase